MTARNESGGLFLPLSLTTRIKVNIHGILRTGAVKSFAEKRFYRLGI